MASDIIDLGQHEDGYRTVFEQMKDAAILVDAESGIVVDANKQAAKLIGRPRHDLIGMHQKSFHPKGQAIEYLEIFAKHTDADSVCELENEVIGRDELRIPVTINPFLVRIDGKSRILAVFRDITDYKRIQERLAKQRDELKVLVRNRTAELTEVNRQLKEEIAEHIQSEEKLSEKLRFIQSILESVPVGVLLIDAKTQEIILINEVGAALLGRAPVDVIGKRCFGLICSTDPTACTLTNRGNRFEGIEQTVRHQSGHSIPVLKTVAPILINERECILESFMDLSRRKRDEQERERLKERLRQSQKVEALGTLAGGVAHDINNILAGIMTVASTMKLDLEADPTELQPGDIEDILEACKRGRDLTLALLRFARKGEYVKTPVALNHAVDEVLKLLRRVVPKEIIIQTRFDPDLAQVDGDPSQLNNVLVNLCINAIDAMKGHGTLVITGENTVLAESQEGLIAGRYVKLQVRDSGSGMDENTIARAFDPFFSTKTESEGKGLGLSRVYGIVRDHDGAVTIDSAVGQGTTMTVFLPALGLTEQDPRSYTTAPPIPAEPNTTVLLVDDEQLLRKTGKRLLRRLGYHVLLASDGKEAIEIFQQDPGAISLVLLDLVMPRMSGEETFAKLRELAPGLPILVCSGYSKDGAAEKLLNQEPVGFIQKPFTPSMLSAELDGILNRPSTPEV